MDIATQCLFVSVLFILTIHVYVSSTDYLYLCSFYWILMSMLFQLTIHVYVLSAGYLYPCPFMGSRRLYFFVWVMYIETVILYHHYWSFSGVLTCFFSFSRLSVCCFLKNCFLNLVSIAGLLCTLLMLLHTTTWCCLFILQMTW